MPSWRSVPSRGGWGFSSGFSACRGPSVGPGTSAPLGSAVGSTGAVPSTSPPAPAVVSGSADLSVSAISSGPVPLSEPVPSSESALRCRSSASASRAYSASFCRGRVANSPSSRMGCIAGSLITSAMSPVRSLVIDLARLMSRPAPRAISGMRSGPSTTSARNAITTISPPPMFSTMNPNVSGRARWDIAQWYLRAVVGPQSPCSGTPLASRRGFSGRSSTRAWRTSPQC